MLLDADDCQLVLIDYQTRLMPSIHEGAAALANGVRLAKVARMVGVPVWATEPLSHTPSVLPSTAREAVPPQPVEDMVAVLLSARLSLPLVTVRVARWEVAEPLAFVATA